MVSTSSVTIRERDTQDQIFVSVEKVAAVVKELCEGRSTWADVLKKYPAALGADRTNRTTLHTETIWRLCIQKHLLLVSITDQPCEEQ